MTWRRWMMRGALVVFGLLLVCAAGLYASAWYHRWRAEQLFAAVRDLMPGVTTEAGYMRAIEPLMPYAVRVETEDNKALDAGYVAVGNQPAWVWHVLNIFPERFEVWASKWSVMEWTLFKVDGTFGDGKLMILSMAELQGSGHHYGAVARVHAGRLKQLFPGYPRVFGGYSARRLNGNGKVIFTHVDLDERATVEERRRALDFRFDCFTAFRSCTDGRRMLDPIPSAEF